MRKIHRAVFIFCFLRGHCATAEFARIQRGFWQWFLLLRGSRKTAGMITIGSTSRAQVSEWALAEFFAKPMDFDIVLHILGGDEYYERNKRDVAKLERAAGRPVVELWDTDPLFAKYPHLRGLARNREFEAMWAKMRQNVK